MSKIKIISPYFGKLPSYINLWSQSIDKNTDIDFYLITDDLDADFYKPKNLHVIYMTFEELSQRLSYKLGIKREISAYKLCDLKPTYGKLFDDFLSNSDYWGYCDIDLVFGNIRKFLEEIDFTKYDKILDLGHFSLIKNNPTMNSLYCEKLLGKRLFDEVKRSDVIKVFDEMMLLGNGGFNGIVLEKGLKLYINRISYCDLVEGCISFQDINNHDRKNCYFYHSSSGLKCNYKVDEKWVVEDILYVHFQKREICNDANVSSDKFYLSEFGVEQTIPKFENFTSNFVTFPEYVRMKKKKIVTKRALQFRELIFGKLKALLGLERY